MNSLMTTIINCGHNDLFSNGDIMKKRQLTNKEINKQLINSDKLNVKRQKKEFFLVSGYKEPKINEYSLYQQDIVGSPYWVSERNYRNELKR